MRDPKKRQWEIFRAELAKSFNALETAEDFEAYQRIVTQALDISQVNADLSERERHVIAYAIASLSFLVVPRRKGAKKDPPLAS